MKRGKIILKNISKKDLTRLIDLVEKDFITTEQCKTLLTVSSYDIRNIMKYIDRLNQK